MSQGCGPSGRCCALHPGLRARVGVVAELRYGPALLLASAGEDGIRSDVRQGVPLRAPALEMLLGTGMPVKGLGALGLEGQRRGSTKD